MLDLEVTTCLKKEELEDNASEARIEEESELKKDTVANEAEVKEEEESEKKTAVESSETTSKEPKPEQVKASPVIPDRIYTSESTPSNGREKPKPSIPRRPLKPVFLAQADHSSSSSTPPPRPPKNIAGTSRVGALRASLFKDLDKVIASGGKPPPPPVIPKKPALHAEGKTDDKQQEKEEEKITGTPSLSTGRRAKGPRGRRLPTAAKNEWVIVSRDTWSLQTELEKVSEKEELVPGLARPESLHESEKSETPSELEKSESVSIEKEVIEPAETPKEEEMLEIESTESLPISTGPLIQEEAELLPINKSIETELSKDSLNPEFEASENIVPFKSDVDQENSEETVISSSSANAKNPAKTIEREQQNVAEKQPEEEKSIREEQINENEGHQINHINRKEHNEEGNFELLG